MFRGLRILGILRLGARFSGTGMRRLECNSQGLGYRLSFVFFLALCSRPIKRQHEFYMATREILQGFPIMQR